MTTRTTVPFDITAWDQSAWHERDGVAAARAEVTKAFAGELSGTSSARVLVLSVVRRP
jgi:hypothetical protein